MRITSLSINNVKNIENGKFEIINNISTEYPGNIIGIYGQNGSGKTSVIDVFNILKSLMSGLLVEQSMVDIIMEGKNNLAIEIVFQIDEEEKYNFEFTYEVKIKKNNRNLILEKEAIKIKDIYNNKKIVNFFEITESSIENEYKFYPEKRLQKYKNDVKKWINIQIEQQIAFRNAASFFFSKKGLDIFREVSQEIFSIKILDMIHNFSQNNFLIFGSYDTAVNYMNLILPLKIFKDEEDNKDFSATFLINLREPSVISEKLFEVMKDGIEKMNIVLPTIVSGLEIYVKEYGKQLSSDGKNQDVRFELVSKRGETLIPIRMESQGIKKIIAILSALIAAYNNENVIVAIDELDAGVFEFLLGELLKSFLDEMKGQLIFTSHNLRILEVLSNKEIIFTTTDPKDRFKRMKNSSRKNFRDVYLRDLFLARDDNCFYQKVDLNKIRRAFRKAGCFKDE